MSLTAQQEFFARLVAEGKSQSEAYRQAYPKAQKWKPGNVWRRSSELSAKPDVLGRIEAIRDELREIRDTYRRKLRELLKARRS